LEMIQRRLIERERENWHKKLHRKKWKWEEIQTRSLAWTTLDHHHHPRKEAASFCKEEAIKFSFYKAQTFKWPSSNSENSTGCIRVWAI
jgi:hypothetical protein